MMQLDDVVGSTVTDQARFEEATHRTTRWLDRCIAAHSRPAEQNLFAIVQGGLDPRLRDISLEARRRPWAAGYSATDAREHQKHSVRGSWTGCLSEPRA